MSVCDHMITQGRPGELGSWCVACGFKRFEVHNQPCSDCKHYDDFRCSKLLMAVTPGMRVTYKLNDDGSNDLCFEPKETPLGENFSGIDSTNRLLAE